MGAGKQRLWSWAVKGSPHRCSPGPASLAGPRRRRKMIACKEALSGASYLARKRFRALPTLLQFLSSTSRSDRRSAETLTSPESIVSTTAVAFAAAPYNMRVWRWVHRTGLRIVDRMRWYGWGHDRCPVGFRSSLSTRGTCDNERLFVAVIAGSVVTRALKTLRNWLRAPACHAGGGGFEPRRSHQAPHL